MTLIGTNYTTMIVLIQPSYLKKKINAEVIDLISIQPLNMDRIIKSVKKTKNLIIVENDWVNCSVSSEIIARILESIEIKIK